MGGHTGSQRRAWIAFGAGTDFGLPQGALVMRAILHTILMVPYNLDPTTNPVITIRRLTAPYSEAQITSTLVQATETANSNWPTEILGTTKVSIPVAPSSPSLSPMGGAPTHFSMYAQLDLTPWWQSIQSGHIASPNLGLLLECNELPTLQGRTSLLYIQSTHWTPAGILANHDTTPVLQLDYGYALEHLDTTELTP